MDNGPWNNDALYKEVERDQAFDAFLAGYGAANEDLGLTPPETKEIAKAFFDWYGPNG